MGLRPRHGYWPAQPTPVSLGAASVFGDDGREVRVRDLWAAGPVVLVFVPHFGSVLCQEQVAELAAHRGQIESSGARVAVIGNGASTFLPEFRRVTGFDGDLYTDPGCVAYEALGLARGLRAVVNLRTLGRAVRAFQDGRRPTDVQGDPLQQGGVVMLSSTGARTYEYRSRFAGDYPSAATLAAAARRAPLG